MSNVQAAPVLPAPVPQPTPEYDTETFLSRIRAAAVRLRDEEGADELRILEAGCGRHWTLGAIDVPGIRPHVTGVDMNGESMRMRIEEAGDLHEAIVGDLRTVELPRASYDVVFCSWVLEHIDGAEDVLDRLTGALKPGGVLLLRIPDRDSVYGLLTRLAPFPLHVAYKRHVRGRKNAGRPGFGPFPTVYDRVVSLRGVSDYCARSGLELAEVYSCNHHLRYFGALAPVVDLGLRAIAAASFGRVTARHNNLAFVLRRTG